MHPLARMACFALFFALLIGFANTFLIKTDTVAALMMQEMTTREDIELCFIGSSVVRDHFNAPLITRLTGRQAFSASVISAGLQADIALAEELFRRNNPQWVVLVLDRFNLNTAKEPLETTYALMPHLSLRTRLDYFRRTCAQDGAYINRLLLFREFGATSPADVLKTIALRRDAAAASRSIPLGEGISYMGAGYLRYAPGTTAEDAIRREMIRVDDPPGYVYELLKPTKDMLLEFRSICEKNGANLLLVVFPGHTSQTLALPDCLPYYESLARFCAAQQIPCFNFTFAKPSFLPRLDGYFFDLYHLNGDGADLFSGAMSKLFLRYTAGEDVGDLFYATTEEYLASLDFITNVWLVPGESHTWTADCNRGSSVTPAYRFALHHADGSETLLRDFDANPVISIPGGLANGDELRVYAMSSGMEEPVYFDYPSDAKNKSR